MNASVWHKASVLLCVVISLSACAPEGSSESILTAAGVEKVEVVEPPVLEIEAATMASKTSGQELGGAWAFFENGQIEDLVEFPVRGEYELTVAAAGDQFEGTGPELEVRLDGERLASGFVSTSEMGSYVFRVKVDRGSHRLGIAYVNDVSDAEFGDRNLYVDKIRVRVLEVEATANSASASAEEAAEAPARETAPLVDPILLPRFHEDTPVDEYWSWDSGVVPSARAETRVERPEAEELSNGDERSDVAARLALPESSVTNGDFDDLPAEK